MSVSVKEVWPLCVGHILGGVACVREKRPMELIGRKIYSSLCFVSKMPSQQHQVCSSSPHNEETLCSMACCLTYREIYPKEFIFYILYFNIIFSAAILSFHHHFHHVSKNIYYLRFESFPAPLSLVHFSCCCLNRIYRC